MLHLDVRQRGCMLEIWLNDIPVLRVDSDEEGFVSLPMHSYLVDGLNVLEVVLAPGVKPSQSRIPPALRKPDAGAHCQVSITRYEVDDFTGEGGQQMFGISWPQGGRIEESFPLVLRASGGLAALFGPWAWQTGRVLNLVNDARKIAEALAAAHQAFRSGDGLMLATQCDLYLREEARAYPAWSVEKLRGRLIRSVEKNGLPGAEVDPLVPDEYDLRLCAGGRLVECVDRTWHPLLRAKGPDPKRRYALPMFLGEVAERMQILR